MADTCKSCGARIEWAMTAKGSRIPLDPGSHPDGNINLGPDGVAHIVGTGNGVRISHFATCPNAGQHRRRQQAGAKSRHPTSRRPDE